MEWSDSQVIRDIISVLATQGWEKLLEENDPMEGIDRLLTRFTIPLQGAQAECDKIKEEMMSILQYAVRFIFQSMMDYRAVWWRIFNAPSSSEWANSLILVELLFSLPTSNGKLERVFSQLNVSKTNKRASLSNESLDDLLMLATDGFPLKDFCPDVSIDLWWRDKVRRPKQKKREQYRKRRLPTTVSSSASSQSDSEHESKDSDVETDLGGWDEWMTQ